MNGILRTALFSMTAIALHGCGQWFSSTEGGGGHGGTAGAGGADSTKTIASGGGGADGGPGGGAGGSPCEATDDDGDGFTECTGDCDDTRADVSPGALEICGDSIDQNCDGKSDADAPCNGIGTYVSQTKGNAGATGTAADPVATINEAIEKAAQIGVPTAILVAAGTYTEEITLVGSTSLLGGYDPESWDVRDPAAHETILKPTSFGGVRVVKSDPSVVVDGFTIQGRAVQAGTDTSIAVTVDGGSPRISNNEIIGAPVTAGPGSSIGLRVITETALGEIVTLANNSIVAGKATLGSAYGVLVDAETLEVELTGNTVTAALGADSIGLHVVTSAGVSARKNTFQSRTAKGSNEPSKSFGAWVQRGPLVFDSNIVNPDQSQDPPDCFTPGAWCGGVRISTPQATITNNVIAGSASSRSAGVHLLQRDGSLKDVVVSSNLILATGHGGPDDLSTVVLLGAPIPDGGTLALVGRFRNNILFGGIAGNNYGFYEEQTPGEPVSPAALDHNLFFFPINVPNPGVLYSDWSGSAAFGINVLDALPGLGKNLLEDPQLVQNHLSETSPCRNAGTEPDAPALDRDQDERPKEGFFDIGPDEIGPPN